MNTASIETVGQLITEKLSQIGESQLVSVVQSAPGSPYVLQIDVIPAGEIATSLSTHANALAARIVSLCGLTNVEVQPIIKPENGAAFLPMQAELQIPEPPAS